ncbi:MAG: glycosyltransferase family 4 protein [Gammaproteobacteria bacterium]|nr:glycosyltransferase family 4 protein [Gammaproteobacteria bacterium]
MAKVLHLRCSGSLLGAEAVILELASSPTDHGYEPVVGVIHDRRDPFPELATTAEKQNINHRVFQASRRIDLACIINIRRYIKSENIDIIHTHGYREDLYALLSHTGRPICATNHLWKRSNLTLMLYAYIDSIAMSQIDHIVAVSQPILEEMEASPFIDNKKLSMISNGIDTKKFHPNNTSTIRDELNINPDTILITAVSSLTSEKGHTYLLDALAQLKSKISDFHLLIIGDGSEQTSIEQQINSLDLSDQVTLLGRRSDINNIHAATDIYALPSLKEGLPMSLLEAMASGVCSVATNVGDISKCIDNNVTGVIVKPRDADALMCAIHTLCLDASIRDRIGRAAATLIQEKFSTETMAGKYNELYNQMLSVNN